MVRRDRGCPRAAARLAAYSRSHPWLGFAAPTAARSRTRETGIASCKSAARGLERGKAPILATVDRHFYPRNPPAPAPGEPGDLIDAWAGQLHLAGRKGDHRLGFHDEGELARFSVAEQIGVFRCLL